MYHAESLNTGFRTAGAAFADESLRTRISLRLRVVPFLRGGGSGGGLPPPAKYCTVLVLESYGPNFTCYIRVFSTIQYAPVHRTKKALMAPQASTSTPTSTRSTAE